MNTFSLVQIYVFTIYNNYFNLFRKCIYKILGLVKPQPTSSSTKRALIPNLMGQAPPPPSPGGRSFAAALRNLAKQAGPPSTHSNGIK